MSGMMNVDEARVECQDRNVWCSVSLPTQQRKGVTSMYLCIYD